jgi:hypothetical protein
MVAMLYKWLLLGFLWVMVSSTAPYPDRPTPSFAHPFYISVTEVNHNASEKSLEISCRIFYDDLESVLKKNYKQAVDLSLDKDKSRNENLIADYLRKHLIMTADGKVLNLQFLGFEKDKEAAWCYFEATQATTPKKLAIVNTILHDFTTEQINIIHATVNGKRQSNKLTYPSKEVTLSF